MKVTDREPIRMKADVLIVGGGLAGLNAAMGAAEAGASVVIMDKGKIERSGDIGGGVDHFMAYLETGPDWDTRKAFLDYVERVGRGTNHISNIESLVCDELPAAIERMARIGNPLTQPDGSYYRTASMGQPGPYWINFNGKQLKPRLAYAVRKLRCKVLSRVMTLDLLLDGEHVAGAVGFHIHTGRFFVVESRSTVVTTGNTNRIFENPRGNPFNTWLCPYNTGDGQVMAFRAGAALTNMEYMRLTMLPKGFAAPGFNALTGMGGRFMNSLGEYYMEQLHPRGNRAPRYACVLHSLEEIRAGRGPIFIDCTGLSDTELAHLETTLGYDKDTLPDYLAQRSEDLRKHPVEIMVSEGMQAGPTECNGSGIKIDGDAAATVPGLFAAGDAADHNRCVHGAVTGGYRAGKSAARHARSLNGAPRERVALTRERMARFIEPLNRATGYPYQQIEGTIRKIMSEHVGMTRTDLGLRTGLQKLARLEPHLDEIKVGDLHELMRARETRSILTVGKMMAVTALYRTESRNKPYHHRLDYPDTDDAKWSGLVVLRRDGGGFECSFERVACRPT
jgi:adenylylsulfate reductase subunit A